MKGINSEISKARVRPGGNHMQMESVRTIFLSRATARQLIYLNQQSNG